MSAGGIFRERHGSSQTLGKRIFADIREQRLVEQRQQVYAATLYDALLALYHACGPEMDGAPELGQALVVLQKVSGKAKP